MPEEIILRHCAPTLAGMKTGSLFSYEAPSVEAAKRELVEYEGILQRAGLRALPLKRLKNGRVLVYIYRRNMLMRDLHGPEQVEILRRCGYQSLTEEACIETLIGHLKANEGFPHEIGLFLGYPPEDVKGFIENHGDHQKYTGTWKVYGNVEKAMEQFARFDRCTRAYLEAGRRGIGLSRLAVRKRVYPGT